MKFNITVATLILFFIFGGNVIASEQNANEREVLAEVHKDLIYLRKKLEHAKTFANANARVTFKYSEFEREIDRLINPLGSHLYHYRPQPRSLPNVSDN